MTRSLPRLDLEAHQAERARRSFRFFVEQAWPVIEPTRALLPSVALDALAAVLQEAARSGGRWAISTPPGTSKSLIASVCFPAWLLLRSNGMARIMCGSYNWDLAARDSVRCRALVQSEGYQRLIAGAWALRTDADRRDDFWTDKSGRRLVASVDGKTTGERCTTQILDDVLSVSDAFSATERKKAARWLCETLPSRLESPDDDTRILVGQRLHPEDPIGVVLAQGGWRHLRLPALADGHPCDLRRADGSVIWRDPRTDGEPLLDLLNTDALARLKVELGSAAFASQYQQDPIDITGAMFKPAWWRFHGATGDQAPRPEGCYPGPAVALPAAFDRVLISVDCTFKSSATSDYVCATVWGQVGACWFLLDLVRRRLSFTETLAMLRQLAARYPACRRVLIEAAANGEAVLDVLRHEVAGIVGVKATESKEARAASVSPLVEAGQVFLPDGAPFLDDYVSELAAFPRGAHDDAVDSTSMALRDTAPGHVRPIHLERGAFARPRLTGPTDEWGRPLGAA